MSTSNANGDLITERLEMIEEIRAMANETGDYAARPISEQVLAAMTEVPRHRFVPTSETHAAYYNHPLPIGYGQTISQPYIVALMTDLLGLEPQHKVLEIGTGSGYQTAVLAELAGRVYSTEIIESLATQADWRLRELGYANVKVKNADGHEGWPEHAPYDAIIVTAAATGIPQTLIAQLKPGGRLVIPVGDGWYAQELILITKGSDGSVHQRDILPVRFVPLTGGQQDQ